mmetsp:Transcript_9180/g.25022  ORF Transcript_9180/g.25022 Transcript_9180/m.25022 type:complete len:315 (-) Transcript_9180:15-959(-)
MARGLASSLLETIVWQPGRHMEPQEMDYVTQSDKPEVYNSPTSKFRKPSLPACLRGTDYGKPCPAGWTEGGSVQSVCKAPPEFVMSTECGNYLGHKDVISGNLSAEKKQELEMQCHVSWPCVDDDYLGDGGYKPNYDEPCPNSWSFQQDGSCAASGIYEGPCVSQKSFLHFTPSMKAAWAANCKVSWPLEQVQLPDPEQSPHWFKPDSHPDKAVWAHCERAYHNACPVGFHEDGQGVCHAPPNYPGLEISGCAQFDPHRWTPEMKQSFEKVCQVAWPCSGEAAIFKAGMGPLLTGLAFLGRRRRPAACGGHAFL